MIEKTLGDKKYFELTEEECKNLIKSGNDALANTYPKGGEGFAVALFGTFIYLKLFYNLEVIS